MTAVSCLLMASLLLPTPVLADGARLQASMGANAQAPVVAEPAVTNPAAAEAIAPATKPVLRPFVATYQVFSDGRQLGEATMQLLQTDGDRWRIDLGMKGSGLMRLTGLNVQQSTLFQSDGHAMRPLAQSTLRRVFLSTRKSTGVYDWRQGSARWSGDVKPSRRAPIALQEGDLNGLLIDLAVIRDAVPGKTLHYRFVDGGRVREHTYVVATETEGVEIDGLDYDAMRVSRSDGNDQTIVWVAKGVPTPIRILQREDGDDSTDLRLIQYQGVTQ